MESKFKVSIKEASKELTAREKIKIKDLSAATPIDAYSQELEFNGEPFVIDVDFYTILDVHNENSQDKDYENIVIVAKNHENPDEWGERFTSGSKTLISALEDIYDELKEAGEDDIKIQILRKDSKNYAGRQFITCTLV